MEHNIKQVLLIGGEVTSPVAQQATLKQHLEALGSPRAQRMQPTLSATVSISEQGGKPATSATPRGAMKLDLKGFDAVVELVDATANPLRKHNARLRNLAMELNLPIWRVDTDGKIGISHRGNWGSAG